MFHIGSGQLGYLGEPVLKTVLRKPGLQEPWLDDTALLTAASNTERALPESILVCLGEQIQNEAID